MSELIIIIILLTTIVSAMREPKNNNNNNNPHIYEISALTIRKPLRMITYKSLYIFIISGTKKSNNNNINLSPNGSNGQKYGKSKVV